MRIKERVSEELKDVSSALGIQLSLAEIRGSREFDYEIRISGIDRPYGFSILLAVDYLSWAFSIDVDEYGASALEAMRQRFDSRSALVCSFVSLAKSRNSNFLLTVNGSEIENLESESVWSDLELSVRQTYSSEENSYEKFRTSILDILCVLLSLLVEEDVWEAEGHHDAALGQLEGELISTIGSKYERSRYNRALCLRYYGFTCRGCGTHMESKYGPLGQNVIHVHHLVPVSQMGGSYRLNPIKDLIPLCPNCHNVVHRVDPPLSIQKLNAQTGYTAL